MNLPESKWGKIGIYGITCVLAIIIGTLGVRHIINSFKLAETDDAYIEGKIHIIAPKIPGTINLVKVEDNQKIKKGDLLVEIDPVDYELRVKEARASLDIRKASLEQATRDKDRADMLYKKTVVPKERYESATTAYTLAKAQLDAAQAQFKMVQRNLEYTKIFSPSDGHITKKAVEVGNQVLPGQALMAVVSDDDMWVVANYKETQLKNIRPGQEARIKIDTYPDKVFEGHVDSIQRGTGAKFSMFPPENAAGNFVKVVQRIPVKIVFNSQPNEKYNFSVGMSVVAEIKIN
jgi:RND family efflux transporter, MFP subunit